MCHLTIAGEQANNSPQIPRLHMAQSIDDRVAVFECGSQSATFVRGFLRNSAAVICKGDFKPRSRVTTHHLYVLNSRMQALNTPVEEGRPLLHGWSLD